MAQALQHDPTALIANRNHYCIPLHQRHYVRNRDLRQLSSSSALRWEDTSRCVGDGATCSCRS
jgi:hypothetical protein